MGSPISTWTLFLLVCVHNLAGQLTIRMLLSEVVEGVGLNSVLLEFSCGSFAGPAMTLDEELLVTGLPVDLQVVLADELVEDEGGEVKLVSEANGTPHGKDIQAYPFGNELGGTSRLLGGQVETLRVKWDHVTELIGDGCATLVVPQAAASGNVVFLLHISYELPLVLWVEFLDELDWPGESECPQDMNRLGLEHELVCLDGKLAPGVGEQLPEGEDDLAVPAGDKDLGCAILRVDMYGEDNS
ncbi:hypothetical protein BDK51DRAFT_41420 [Blyttiomyces helicus]|uniref:Uncharacterized protein n=1 Tax=Blyttiomyces helicus TaxID=388810 RepID=A0A4P9WJE6_9FUNG|nr:hypothetical protein BDK51DRAFT_41420 [Blyttiomyces helicus]|eukprot:RKO93049.1 hypothetical protein BDK51DRAFT_41420 [Blyttiomyces helicus]